VSPPGPGSGEPRPESASETPVGTGARQAVLGDTDALLRHLTENARDVLFRVRLGPPRVYEYVSPAVAAMVGYHPEDFYRDPELGTRIVHPADRHLVGDKGPAPTLEDEVVVRWLHRDGRVVHVEPRLVVIRDERGEPVAVEGIVRDVSAAIRAEEALRESECRLRSVFSAMAEGVLIFDGDGRLRECNAAAERLLRRSRKSLLEMSSTDDWHVLRDDGTPLPPPEYPPNRTLKTGEPVRDALLGAVQPDGTVRWLSLSSEGLRHSGENRPDGVLVSFADRTGERRAWVEVRRREAQLRLALECSGHDYWELDLSRGELVAGRTLELALPSRPTEIRAWCALVHPDDRQRAQADLEEHVSGRRRAFLSEFRLPAPDGQWRWILAAGRAVVRDPKGRATRLAGTATDITEAKRLQERLREADRLAGVGTLAAGVAHEINNPLSYVTANLAVLDEALGRLAGTVRGDPAGSAGAREMRQALREAMDGARRVRGIVQALRQFAQPGRGEERRPVDVRAEIEAAVGMARNEIAQRARLLVEIPDELPPVEAAPHELGQVFVNLLVNAAQAIPEGHASDNEIRIVARASGDRVQVEVRDSGSGILPADLAHIFDPFFTTKRAEAGTGLGLSVCHGIVKALGGTIDVESTPGKGTTFRVSLPARREEAAPSPGAAASAPAPARRGKVLVVDDEALVGKSLARLLAAHEVTVLTSPLEALSRAAKGERWDVVLCDLMMPEMSGMDLEERLSEMAPDLVPHIVYLTGGAFTERSRTFLAAGRPHLEKPVDPTVLRAQVAARIASLPR